MSLRPARFARGSFLVPLYQSQRTRPDTASMTSQSPTARIVDAVTRAR
ncbi:hypothetical protein ACU4GA_27025 [Methylobacterium oryzae CBMB20]